jgi:hypothetical protein
MATYDLTTATGDVGVNPARAGEARERLVKITWDGVMGVAADVIQCMKVPVGATIVDLKMGSDDLGTTNVNVGYGTTANYFFSALNLGSALNWPTTANAAGFIADPLTIAVGSTPIDEVGYDTIDIVVIDSSAVYTANAITYIYAKWLIADDAP